MVLGQSALLPAPDSQHFVEGEGSVDTYIYVCVCGDTVSDSDSTQDKALWEWRQRNE